EFLARACASRGIEAVVQSRAKSVPSFGEKVVRKYDKYQDAVHQFTDLCGARIITLTQAEADRMCELIRASFQIDEANSEDVRQRLAPDRFGYASIHYIVQMPWIMLLGLPGFRRATRGVPVDRLIGAIGSVEADRGLGQCFRRAGCRRVLRLLGRVMRQDGARLLKEAMQEVLRRKKGRWRGCRGALDLVRAIGNRKAEIQVKTVLQHAWAAIGHDRLYKTDYTPPPRLQRRLHRIAAILEEADDEFAGGVAELDALRLDYGSFMTYEKRRAELKKWQVALAASPSVELANKVARLAVSVEDWSTAEKVLGRYRKDDNAEVLSLLGLALFAGHGTGRTVLREAAEADPTKVAAWCSLGDSYCPKSSARGMVFGLKVRGRASCPKAAVYYAKAFECAPTDPRAVTSYAACRLCSEKNPDALRLLRPLLENVCETSGKLAETKLHIPWSLYDVGTCALLLGRAEDAVEAYAEAVYLSDGVWPIRCARAMIERIQCGLAGMPPKKLTGVPGSIGMFLDMAAAAQSWKREQAEWNTVDNLERKLATAKLEMRGLKKRQRQEPAEVSASDIKKAGDNVAKLGKQLAEAKARHREEEQNARQLSSAFRKLYLPVLRRSAQSGTAVPAEGACVILAGSCDEKFETSVQGYRDTVVQGFGGFRGTIYSGGTNAGIGRLAGDVQETYGRSVVRTVTYLPRRMASKPKWVKIDRRYTDLRRTEGNDFSLQEPLFSWADIIASGIKPYDVKVVGINGGRIAGAEYRIALAFGATVAVFEKGGREAARLMADETWGVAPALIQLPKDALTLRAFVGSPARGLTPAQESTVAEAIHEGHRDEKRKSGYVPDPAMLPWKELSEVFRRSSIEQARDVHNKLRAIGCTLRRAPRGREPVQMTFTKQEIETMAEMEHARWVVERLRLGWKLGPKKDEREKTSPYLVPWSELPEDVKEWDRATVRKMPAYLAKVGLEIVR
ncbi:MAG: RyR domain-containing protein, partial [candidate division WOR-3 bacterium]